MSLLGIFQWLGATPVGVFMQKSTYAFATVEMIHLLALAALGGAVLALDLRLLGLRLSTASPEKIARGLRGVFLVSLALISVSGVLLLAEEPLKCYYNDAFRLKMPLFLLALAVQAGTQTTLSRQPSWNSGLAKTSGGVSLLLWLGVGLAGRTIGLL